MTLQTGRFATHASRHPLFRTQDREQARQMTGRALKPFRLDLLTGSSTVDAVQNYRRLDRLAFSYLTMGGAVRIDPGVLQDFYLIQIPTAGHCDITYGNRRTRLTLNKVSIIAPERRFSMVWSHDCALFEVKIDRAALQAFIVNYAGLEIDQPIDFALELASSNPAIDGLSRLLSLMCAEIEDPDSALSHGATTRPLEEALLAMLLDRVPNDLSETLATHTPTGAPANVRKAEAFIAGHIADPLSMSEIAHASGASVRALQGAFRRYRNTTPMSFLRDLRLDRCHHDLSLASPGDVTVTEVALRWGFTHLGRFSRDFARRFGEFPSSTLGSRRKH